MSREIHSAEPGRDPELEAYLRWAEGEVPTSEVDWDALRRSTRERAELALARRRSSARRARWLRPLVPLAVAAGVGALALFEPQRASQSPSPSDPAAGTMASLEEVLRQDVSEQEFRLIVSERANPDDLLQIAANAD